ncbi:MAG: glycine zipper 2TM domain-containing protein [Bdellovibrionales bacterium]
MKTPFLIFAVTAWLVGFSFPACASDDTLLSTGVGAALGGFVGSQIGKGDGQLAATGAGVFLGGMMGNSIGHSMDRAGGSYARSYPSYNTSYNVNDEPYSSYAPNYVAPYDYPLTTRADVRDYVYVRPGSVEYYSPRQTVLVEGGYVGVAPPLQQQHRHRHCREFTQTTRIEGRVHESYGTACLRPDGSWQVVQ